MASVVVAYGLSRSVACGIFPDQGSNLCPVHWQADSYALHHQGSPSPGISMLNFLIVSSPIFLSLTVGDNSNFKFLTT